MSKLALTIIAFMTVSFGVQGLSHFVINVDHFAGISFMRQDPVMPLGLLAMVVEASVVSYAVSRLWPDGITIGQGVMVSACFGLFLASYIALAEPAKYAVPSIPAWIVTEAIASTIQFGIFGVLLGFIYRRNATAPVSEMAK